MLTWHCCRYGELSAAAESLLNHEVFSPVCPWASVLQEHVSCLAVSRGQGESTSPGAWGEAGEAKGRGAGTVLGSPAATSHLGWESQVLGVSSPHPGGL